DRLEPPTPAHITDERVIAKRIVEPGAQPRALARAALDQLLACQHALHRKRGGARNRMPDVGMSVLEEAAAGRDRIDHAAADEYRADRLINPAETLRNRHQAGRHARLLAGVQRAGAPHSAHYFVEDQQDAVRITDLAYAPEVERRRHQAAAGRATHRLRDDGAHIGAADSLDRRLQLGREARTVLLRGFAVALIAVSIGRRDMLGVDQQRRELATTPRVAADRECAEGVAVVAVATSDEARALRLALLDEGLARKLQRSLDRFGSARNEVDMRDARRRTAD